MQLFEKKGEGRAGHGFRAFRGRAAQGEGQGQGQEKGRVQGRQGAGRVGGQGQGSTGPRGGQGGRRQGAGAGHRGQGRVARFHFVVFLVWRPHESRFCSFLKRKGGGQGRVWVQSGLGQGSTGPGPGHRGQGRVARFHFQVFKPTSKITFLQLFAKKGEGRAGQGLGSERLGAGQGAGQAGRRQGAGAGRAVAGFHFEVFKA